MFNCISTLKNNPKFAILRNNTRSIFTIYNHKTFLNLLQNRLSLKKNKIKISNKLLNTPIKGFFKASIILLNRNRNYNFYEVLGVDRNSTNEQVKQAFIKLEKQYHPDVNKDIGADDRYKDINFAYDALSIELNRDLYDAYIENDPHMNDWNFWKEEDNIQEGTGGRKTHRNQDPSGSSQESEYKKGFGQGNKNDFDNVFNAGFKEAKAQKGDDINVI